MKTKFINAISSGNFPAAKQLLQTIPAEKIISFLTDLTFETNLIGIYTVLTLLLVENENIFFHNIAISVLCVSMWEGANASAFLHAKRIVELAPTDIQHKKHLLDYIGTPDCTMSHKEAICIAKEILKQDPADITALQTIARITDKDNQSENLA